MQKLIIIILIFLTACSKETISEKNKLEEKGYLSKEMEIINNLKQDAKDILEKYDYNSSYIELIQHEDFKEEELQNYISFFNENNLDIDQVIYIVNNHYNDSNINYDQNTLNLMKSKYYIHKNLERYLNFQNNSNTCNNENDIASCVISKVNSNLDYDYYTNTTPTDLSKGYLIIVNKYNNLDQNYVPDNLVNIDSKYGINGYLEKETYEQFKKMADDALKENVHLYAFSPYRSYSTQYTLYNRYVQRDGKKLADTYSARAGFSEHQTGLAIDITTTGGNLNGFENSKEFRWLKENAQDYGFILRYPEGKEDLTGYQYEPWHYRYVGVDIAKQIKELDITFEEYYAYFILNQN